jgi:hypothetical protein
MVKGCSEQIPDFEQSIERHYEKRHPEVLQEQDIKAIVKTVRGKEKEKNDTQLYALAHCSSPTYIPLTGLILFQALGKRALRSGGESCD